MIEEPACHINDMRPEAWTQAQRYSYIHEIPIAPSSMDAPAPFDSSAISDTIIRTSDNTHFYVLGAFLYYVSETFRDKLSLNRGPAATDKNGELPVLDFSEDSKIFNILLEYIYPRVDEPQFHDLGIFKRTCKAAQAYSITVVLGKLKKQILTSSFIREEPFRWYAIAIVLGWEEVALVAAHATLKIPLKELVFVDDLKDISGTEFYRFLNYRFRCDVSENASKQELALTRQPPSDKSVEECLTGAGPYVTSSNSNLILRSSDSVDFFVIEGLIRFVSPFFDRKFPLKDSEEIDGRPVIAVPERSNVLRGLLDIIYPGEDDNFDVPDCHLYGEMVRAARNFEISTAEKKLRKQGTALACKEPLRMYAIATSLGWVEVAKIAAINTLSQPLRDMTFVDEFDQITGADLFRLMHFRFKCARVVCNVVRDNEARVGFEQLRLQSHGHITERNPLVPSSHYSQLPHELRQRLEDCPRGDTYRAICVSDIAHRLGFPDPSSVSIKISVFNVMEKYRDELVGAIEDAISKVCSISSLIYEGL